MIDNQKLPDDIITQITSLQDFLKKFKADQEQKINDRKLGFYILDSIQKLDKVSKSLKFKLKRGEKINSQKHNNLNEILIVISNLKIVCKLLGIQ